MRNETKILIVIIVVIGLGLVYTVDQVSSLEDRVDEIDHSIIKSGITIDNEDVARTYTVNLTRGASALEALQRVAKVETQSYPGMGVYVTEINGLHENSNLNKYWIVYKLSDENQEWTLLNTGVGSYQLKEGDNIKFSYEKASF